MNDRGLTALRQLRQEVYLMSLLVRALGSGPAVRDEVYFLTQLERCARRADDLSRRLGWERPPDDARSAAVPPDVIPVSTSATRPLTTALRPK